MKSRTGTRRGTIILAALIIAAAVVGCGQPGADGDAYIAYSWAVGPITIDTNDPAFAGASYIYNGEFRQTSPGVYDFEYTAWDDSEWWGWYEIYVNSGEDGKPFGAGEDGTDLYFELLCLSTGPSFYIWEDLSSAALGTEGTEPLAVLGAGLPEAPAPEAEGAGKGAPGAGPGVKPGGVETAAKTAGRPAAVVETAELPGYTVVFGFAGGAE
ncbi:MAG: hypothetical protein ACLFPV_15625 [Spirochaetaceae bacterium]